MSYRRPTLTVLAVIAFALTGNACSSSSKPNGTPTPRYLPTIPGAPTELPTLTGPLELPTIGDPLELPLETRSGGAAVFTVDVPPGWEQDSTAGHDQFSLKIGPYTGALFTVDCGKPNGEYTARSLADAEVASLAAHTREGSVDVGSSDLTVNGRQAAVYYDKRSVGFGAGTTGANYFIADKQCAWTLRFVITANTEQVGEYRQLFGRIVSSLRPVGPSR